MLSYRPPLGDVRFVLRALDISHHLPALDLDLADAIFEEAGRFAADVIAPLNQPGDRTGCARSPDGTVITPAGYRDAYRQYREAGWGTLALPEAFGGQGLPHVLATVVEEFFDSACHAFNMYPGLTHGAVAALMDKGAQRLKDAYLPQLVSGEWLGTMALTEAHAGTDLGLIRTRAAANSDGSYAITGEKIFCSGGEHDLTENIVHLVLAKVAGSPAGSRGISLFLVPKVLPGGTRNAVTCGAIEHKMGVHGSATCVMNFDGAAGWLIGEENAGLATMFIMMNAARLSCGNQGLAQAELAYQNAAIYALERKQGRAPGSAQEADALIVHPDVRRMLMDARAFTQGFRALLLWTALQIDLAHSSEARAERAAAEGLVSFITPVLKAYGTDRGFETAVAMQQVFGGHGYVVEWGMEQIVRDARAAMLYEGANGVQALDLAGRKLARDGGAVAESFFALIDQECANAPDELAVEDARLGEAVAMARECSTVLIASAKANLDDLGAGSYAYLQLIGIVAVGWMWLRLARSALDHPEDPQSAAKLVTARYYCERSLPLVAALKQRVEASSALMMALAPEDFAPQG